MMGSPQYCIFAKVSPFLHRGSERKIRQCVNVDRREIFELHKAVKPTAM